MAYSAVAVRDHTFLLHIPELRECARAACGLWQKGAADKQDRANYFFVEVLTPLRR
jgi:hypothetical protein